ncbi:MULTISPECIES: hypothetical protein [Cyanophyceae]|uniref:hypothetical protein n=1 Tax=Cyanophyceae TaxID=3028117 RepID=UPI001685124E|nr:MULTISPECIES: hypothetical protein [Cyanophyceae]MBD1915475.1 hypothetical protein [Phormidium sp. FACHB-77]MBD2031785.1 hypothetical protein [Phormidium sp. FACHB-322]MBD2050535.1 hypothetical protein [Leptolyngbya sp. FACHB-60]
MGLNLAKSPWVRSIGGVGAIAATLISLSYLSMAGDPAPAPELTLNNFSVSPWQQGTDFGWQAAVAAQTAQTPADWQRVSDLWGQAIATLESVPATDATDAQAQAKAEQYRGNRAIAGDRLAKASPSASVPTAASNLQTALAAAEPAFTFSPGPNARTVGRSADGLATVELGRDRATLVLPRSPQGKTLTMAQVVHANQFLTLATPETATQPWLIESLRNVQRNQPPAIPAEVPVILSAGADSLSITVVTEP